MGEEPAERQRRRVALGTCRIEKDVRFDLPSQLATDCPAGGEVEFTLECHYRETTRDREVVRIVLGSDLAGAAPSLYDFTDRPGIPDKFRITLPHVLVAPDAPGEMKAVLRASAECIRQPWDSYRVLAWERGERTIPVTVRVT